MALIKRKCHFCGEMREILTHRGIRRICSECRASEDRNDPIKFSHGDPEVEQDYGNHKPPQK